MGRLHPEKRPALAARGVEIVTGADLHVLGDGSERGDLEAEFSSNDRIHLHGAVPNADVAKWMQRATGLIVTSEYEGSPKAVLEAMSCGAPVIAVRVPGLEDLIVDGETGLLADETPDGIADAIGRLVRDRPLRERISRQGREWVIANHSQHTTVVLEAELLREVTRSCRQPNSGHW